MRRHVHTLERERLISIHEVKQSIGRPYYHLTEKGNQHFPSAYEKFCLDFLNVMEALQGEKVLRELFRKVANHDKNAYEEVLGNGGNLRKQFTS